MKERDILVEGHSVSPSCERLTKRLKTESRVVMSGVQAHLSHAGDRQEGLDHVRSTHLRQATGQFLDAHDRAPVLKKASRWQYSGP
jgi:hypothetical protein